MRIGLIGAGRIGAFHAGTLRAHAGVGELLVADADAARARQVAARCGGRALPVDALFAARPDALVIASATAAHAGLIARAARAGIPAFCEKPIAVDLPGTVAALAEVEAAGAVLQIGFQRRFDAGYAAARAAVAAGRLGRLHTVRTVSSDAVPPPAAYVPLSGGLYRDCLIHDFDILRWVTGREVTEVYAAGANAGADFFLAAGDVDTAAVLLTLEGGLLATATATRYHAAGYDVRMELAGSEDQFAVGVTERTPWTAVEQGAARGLPGPAAGPAGGAGPASPAVGAEAAGDAGAGRGAGGAEGPAGADVGRPGGGAGSGTGAGAGRAWSGFLERFGSAYRAEMDVFLRVARGAAANPCEGRDALRALLVAEACEVSRRERRPVRVAEIAEAAHGAGVAQARARAAGAPGHGGHGGRGGPHGHEGAVA
ncbi:Gfo/Idh/MocA family protein [Actinacidiphila epipremni]|uniref:Gfo/Idh/MocA family protein n=1 Tax=Actinacidiphila epipremni TaxID=2053013 RepID=UPI001F0D9FD7|nr:Gfo/Idh/MocA family oxidoreductase [Actinacidiphila epipremni]